MNSEISYMQASDWEEVWAIYLEGMASGLATFETDVPSRKEWDNKHLRDCRLVARQGGRVVGWAALSPVSSRCVYVSVAEVSIYVAREVQKQGIGKALLHRLIGESENVGFWTLQSGIFLENKASIALHKSCGFREVGLREHLGKSNGVWRDVVLMERRSKVVGVD